MNNNYIFKHLHPNDVDEIIVDKCLQYVAGYRFDNIDDYTGLESVSKKLCEFYLVVDSHDISSYCFPLLIGSALSETRLAAIVDTQIVCHDIMFLHEHKPILLEEYDSEISSFISYIDTMANDYKSKEYKFEYLKLLVPEDNKGYVDSDVGYNLILGVSSFGTERLNMVYENVCKESDQLIKRYLIDYKPPSNLKYLVKLAVKLITTDSYTPSDYSVANDIRAISKVYHLNKKSEEYFLKNGGKRRVFIYISSANRTKYILEILRTKAKYRAYIDNYDFPIWRRPLQVYQYLICRVNSSDGESIDLKRTIEMLNCLKTELENEVSEDGKTNKSELKYKEIYERNKQIFLKDFRRVENAVIKIPALPERIESDMDFVLKYIKIPEVTNANKEELEMLRTRINVNINLLPFKAKVKIHVMRSIITNIYDAFPLFVENDKDCSEILSLLFGYWTSLYKAVVSEENYNVNKEKYLAAIDRLQELEIESRNIDADRYAIRFLVRILDQREVDLYKLEEDILFIRNLNEKFKVNENMFYFHVFVLRMQHDRLDDAYKLLMSGDKLKLSGFHYCYNKLVLLTAFVLLDRGDEVSMEVMGAVMAEMKDIIQKFDGLNDIRRMAKASVLSNACYICAYYSMTYEWKNNSVDGILLSHEYLNMLKKTEPKESWSIYPDFKHTEAYLEYCTLVMKQNYEHLLVDSILPSKDWQNRLAMAKRDIWEAYEAVPSTRKKEIYQKLIKRLDEIDLT